MPLYSKHLSVPQTQPIPGRSDMVKNNAGGYVFKIEDEELLERFILIGSEGGTYYVNEQKLTVDNATSIISMIKNGRGMHVASVALDSLSTNSAPKPDPALFVLALVATYGDTPARSFVYDNLYKFARTFNQMVTFFANVKTLKGVSSGLRRAVSLWYNSMSPDKLARQLIKYRERQGFSHRDILRLCHVKPSTPQHDALFGYVTKKKSLNEIEGLLERGILEAFEVANSESSSVKDVINAVEKGRLSLEMINNTHLKHKAVLNAAASNLGTIALLRNMNRYTAADVVDENYIDRISKEASHSSRVHPINVFNSLRTYEKGKGEKGSLVWSPNSKLCDALIEAFENNISSMSETTAKVLVAVDVSGSMRTPVGGYTLNASEVATTLAYVIKKTNKNSDLVWFSSQLWEATVGRRNDLSSYLREQSRLSGGTDCSLPFQYAQKKLTKYDAIVILTDSETWAGKSHPVASLKKYRNTINKDVKVIEVALTATPSSTLPKDKNFLRVVGFDASVMDVMNRFIER